MMRARGVGDAVDIPGYRESYFGQVLNTRNRFAKIGQYERGINHSRLQKLGID
jgi:hypothetical protein